jgi:hypothetical protein
MYRFFLIFLRFYGDYIKNRKNLTVKNDIVTHVTFG